MFPALPQRLLIALAFAIGLIGMLVVLPALRPGDLSSGISLVDDGSSAALRAIGLLTVAALPAVIAGIVVSATGNPLSGVFSVAAALMVLACRGGSISGWLYRHQLPGDYTSLIGEALIYALAVFLLVRIIQSCRPILELVLPSNWLVPHFGMSHADKDAPKDKEPQPLPHRGVLAALFLGPGQRVAVGRDVVDQLGALAISAIVGGGFSYLLLRSTQTGQVMCGLIIAFALAGLITHLVFPFADMLPILLGPLLAAVGGYAWFLLNSPAGNGDVLAVLYTGRLVGLPLALPIHFASAGVAGAAVGIGWAQGFLASDEEEMRRTRVVARAHGGLVGGLFVELVDARRRQLQRQQNDDEDKK